MAGLDRDKYEVVPVYITKANELWTGPRLGDIGAYKDIPGLLKSCRRAAFRVWGDRTYLETLPRSPGSRPAKARWTRLRRTSAILIDVALPVVHGTNVEDGALQGFLETVNLPYVGANVLASAVGMDKFTMKVMLAHGGLPVLPGLRFSTADWHDGVIVDRVEAAFSYPVIVKPVNLGSSVGISKADDADQLRAGLESAFSFARHVLVESGVANLREINCAVLGDELEAEASECEEPVMTDQVLSYQDKYLTGGKDGSKKSGMASLKRKIPAEITPEQRQRIRALALEAFRYLDLSGVTRVDFLMDGATGEIWLNEVNTIPGSLAFYLWAPLGISYPDLLDRLIKLALKRQRLSQDLTHSFETNILAGASTGVKGGKAVS